MVICDKCGKRLVTPSQMTKHLASVHEVMEVSESPVEQSAEVSVVPEVVAEAPSAPVETQGVPVDTRITLRFKVPVEVAINGIKYEGRIIKVPDMSIASEIVRIVRESAYGDVLER